jgi:hypothetical protein
VLPEDVQQWLTDDLGVYDPALGTLERPHHTGFFVGRGLRVPYTTDGYGFRNAWPWPDTAEIVVVGDAVAFGDGVEEGQAWPALLAHTVVPNRVLNLGLREAGPQQYARVYATFGTARQPKLVLVALTLDDDFQDAELFAQWEHAHHGAHYRAWRQGRDLVGSLGPPLDVAPTLLARHSYLFQALRSSLRTELTSSDLVWLPGGQYIQVWPHRLAATFAQAQPDRHALHLVLDALRYVQIVARASGAQVLVVLQPSKEAVYLPTVNAAVLDLASVVRQALAQHGIASLDLTPVLQQWAAKGEALFFAANRYPNHQGHTRMAQAVVRHLADAAQTYGLRPWGQVTPQSSVSIPSP